jgi:hypothetical protein
VGDITNQANIGDIVCEGNEKKIPFAAVEKLAFDSQYRSKGALIFYNYDPVIPSHLSKEENCKFGGLAPLQFKDLKSGRTLEIKFSDLVDYVRNMKTGPLTGPK